MIWSVESPSTPTVTVVRVVEPSELTTRTVRLAPVPETAAVGTVSAFDACRW